MNETELLFSEVLGCDRTALYLDKAKILDQDKLALISSVLKRRIKGEPIQYILGKTEFMALKLKVNRDVLIPRPETEILVETTLKYADKIRQAEILDLGTGSGCIAISLGKRLVNAKIDAIDISDKALAVAEENAGLNGVKIDFIRSDLFDSLGNREYDIIVSNPPYIADDEIGRLQPELQFEPRVALSAGVDGLDFYRRISLKAAGHLKKDGLLIMEIGFGQRLGIEKTFLDSRAFKITEAIKDYSNIDRVIVAQKI
ncbi:MAG: peptide chain release factor N(5)-glutamine methyltransferase [Candidatus Omnitrophota bacterium]|jgi:release factor glutamine methyltransferase